MRQPLVQKSINHMQAKTPAVWQRYSKDEFKACIEKYYGIVTVICNILDCTYTQFYSAIKHWDLHDFLIECKQNLVSKAESVILNKMDSDNDNIALKAAEITLKSKFAKDWQNNNVQEITVKEGDKETIIKQIFNI